MNDLNGLCDKAEWKRLFGRTKSCNNGSFAIGAEIGLHDDYGHSNINLKYYYKGKYRDFELNYYRASILNVRLYCSEYTEQDGRPTTMLEGERHSDHEHYMGLMSTER